MPTSADRLRCIGCGDHRWDWHADSTNLSVWNQACRSCHDPDVQEALLSLPGAAGSLCRALHAGASIVNWKQHFEFVLTAVDALVDRVGTHVSKLLALATAVS